MKTKWMKFYTTNPSGMVCDICKGNAKQMDMHLEPICHFCAIEIWNHQYKNGGTVADAVQAVYQERYCIEATK